MVPLSVICKASDWRSKILFLQDIASCCCLCYDIQKVFGLTRSIMHGVHLSLDHRGWFVRLICICLHGMVIQEYRSYLPLANLMNNDVKNGKAFVITRASKICYCVRKFILWTKFLAVFFGTGSVDHWCGKFSTFINQKMILECLSIMEVLVSNPKKLLPTETS